MLGAYAAARARERAARLKMDEEYRRLMSRPRRPFSVERYGICAPASDFSEVRFLASLTGDVVFAYQQPVPNEWLKDRRIVDVVLFGDQICPVVERETTIPEVKQ